MSIFKPNLDNFTTKFFVLPAGEWELEVAKVSLRSVDIRNGKNAGNKMHMVSVSNRVIGTSEGDKDLANKSATFDFIVNVDQADGFNRVLKFAMVCNGIVAGTDEADAEFRQRFGGEDWSVDVETGTLGSGWTMLQNKRYIGTTVIGGNLEYPRPELKSFRPF
jgi:hypothetical protein